MDLKKALAAHSANASSSEASSPKKSKPTSPLRRQNDCTDIDIDEMAMSQRLIADLAGVCGQLGDNKRQKELHDRSIRIEEARARLDNPPAFGTAREYRIKRAVLENFH